MNSRGGFRLASTLALPLAVLFAAASVGNILLPGVYARETATWAAQGLGQDWVDLLVVAPLLILSARGTRRGSVRWTLVLGGTLAYTAYSFVLYAFAVHFNSLFLVYTLALGLSFYALVNCVIGFSREAGGWFAEPGPARAAGLFAILVGSAFYALWLSEIVPATVAGAAPPSAVGAGLITSPVQILDIGIVLPAFIIGGVALVRRRPLGYWLVPMMLAFGVVMDLALIGMVLSMAARGLGAAGPRLAVFTLMGVVSLALLLALLRRADVAAPRGTGTGGDGTRRVWRQSRSDA